MRFARLNMDRDQICWNRVLDLNDRLLRRVEIGHGAQEQKHKRITEYAITVSSEVANEWADQCEYSLPTCS